MARGQKFFWFSAIFSLLLYFLLPLSPAYAELTQRQQETLEEFYKRNKEFSKAGPVPLKDLVQHEKFGKALDKYGDLLFAIETLKKIRETKDFDAFQDGIWKLEKMGLKKFLPGWAKLISWTGWAKAVMELFKAYAWDPMLREDQIDTYNNNRWNNKYPPEQAITYVAVDMVQVKDAVKEVMKRQGHNVDLIFDKNGNILPRWQGAYREALLAMFEWEYQKRYHQKITEELEREAEKELEMLNRELLAELQKPALHFTGVPAQEVGVFEVGETVDLVSYYSLTNVPGKKTFLVKEGWSLRGPVNKTHQGEKDIAPGSHELGAAFKITPEFAPGEYHLSFNVSIPELGLFGASRVTRFRVGDLFLKIKQQVEAARGLLSQCKLKEALAFSLAGSGLDRLAKFKEGSPEVKNLYELALATDQEIKAMEGILAAYLDLKKAVNNQISSCDFTNIDSLLQSMNKYLEKSPAACGLRGDFDALSKNALYVRAAYGAAEELLSEGIIKKTDRCDFEGAVRDANKALAAVQGLSCERARELVSHAQRLIEVTQRRIQARQRFQQELAAAEKLIQARKRKEAEEKLTRLRQDMGDFWEDPCFKDLRARHQNLWAKLFGTLSVKIAGKPETGLGQGVDFFGEITLDGVKVNDPDTYTYRWEATGIDKPWTGKSVKYAFQQPGPKTIRLTVTDSGGRSAAATASLKVAPALKVKIHASKEKVAIKEKVTLTPEIAEEKEECPCTYEWTASHVKGVITDQTAWFIPGHPVPHTVNLTVKNRFGQTASASVKVMVHEPKLAVKISGPAEIGLGQNADFSSEVTLDGAAVKDPDAYTYRWEATDANAPWTGKSVRYPFKAPGQKNIRLTVTGPGGRTATAAVNLKVAPALSFKLQADKAKVFDGEKVTFSAAIQGEKEQCPCSYQWTASNFDKAINDPTAWFKYPQPGTYAISLTVKNRFGQTASATYNLVVKSSQEEIARLAAEERERRRQEAERARRAEEERLAREKEKARLAVEERARQERERTRLAEEERVRREKEKARLAEEERIRREREKARLAEEERLRREREKARLAQEERRRQEAARIKKAEEEQKKREEEIRTLRNKIAEWQKALDCLLEGKRKYPKSDLTCHGNWTMRSRDTEIAHFRGLIKDAQARLNKLTGNPRK